MGWPARTDKERFFAKVEQPPYGAACWIWTGARSTDAYGHFFYRGVVAKAHRAAWMLFRGEIPDGLLVCHRCDNPKCVNPEHLFLGEHLDNAHDKMKKGRHTWANKTHCIRDHELSGDNLYITSQGSRSCKECQRMHGREYDRNRRPSRKAVA